MEKYSAKCAPSCDKLIFLFVIALFSMQAFCSQAKQTNSDYSYQSVSVEYLTGVSDMYGMRLAYRPKIYHTLDLPVFGEVALKYEAAIILFDLHGSAKNEATYGASVSPILLKKLEWFEDHPLFLEVGIGLAYVHNKKFGGVDIGSYYQFEDRLGVFTKFGKHHMHSAGLRWIHYSNGGLNTKNPGLDFIGFVYQAKF